MPNIALSSIGAVVVEVDYHEGKYYQTAQVFESSGYYITLPEEESNK